MTKKTKTVASKPSYQAPETRTISVAEAIDLGMTSTQVRAIANSLERIAKSDKTELCAIHLYNPKDQTHSTSEFSAELRNFNSWENFRNARALHTVATELRKRGM